MKKGIGMTCKRCSGQGWVCTEHQGQAFGDCDECNTNGIASGTPCQACFEPGKDGVLGMPTLPGRMIEPRGPDLDVDDLNEEMT